MKCIKCEYELQAGARYCTYCGTKQPELLHCSKCGMKDIHYEAIFCPECGNRVSTSNKTAEEKSVESLNEKLKESKENQFNLESRLKNILSENDSLEKETKDLQNENAKLKEESKTLKSNINELNVHVDKCSNQIATLQNDLNKLSHRTKDIEKRENELKLKDDSLAKESAEIHEKLKKSEANISKREEKCASIEEENRRLSHKVAVMTNGCDMKWWIWTLRWLCLSVAFWNIGALVYYFLIVTNIFDISGLEGWWTIIGGIFVLSIVIGWFIQYVLKNPRLGGSKFIRFCASLFPSVLFAIFPFFNYSNPKEALVNGILYYVILFVIDGIIFCSTNVFRNGVYFKKDL